MKWLGKDITYQNYDVVFKLACEVFCHNMLDFLGLDLPEIEDIYPTELPAIEADAQITDFIFKLKDDSLLHLEFQRTYSEEDLYRFFMYDARLISKHRRIIRTVVIYLGDSITLKDKIQWGAVTYNIDIIYMNKYDGDKIFQEEMEKVERNEKPDALNMTFLPLMRSSKGMDERVKDIYTLLKASSFNSREIESIMAGIIVLVDKMLDESAINKIWEEISMLNVIKFAEKKGLEEGIVRGTQDTILRLLLAKFKDLPGEYEEKIREQDEQSLNIIATKILEMKRLEELKDYLH